MEEYIRHGRGEQTAFGPNEIGRILRELPSDLAALWRSRHMIQSMAGADLRIRYHRSSLGLLWTLLNPLLMLTVLAVVFSEIMRIEMKNFAVYVFSGLLPWQFFIATILDGGRSLISNEVMIKKVRLNKIAFPLTRLLVAGVNWLFATVALFLVLMAFGATPGTPLLALPAVMLLWVVFALGLALVSMTLITYFRDCEHLLEVFLQALYFASPILYPVTLLQSYERWLQWNPITHFMNLFHLVIYESTWPVAADWFVPAALSVASITFGYIVFKRREDDFVFRL